jgi:RNA polymerase sigma-70 factor (ECF subfamily)
MSELDPHELGALLGRVRDGDPGAFNDLLTRLRPYLHSLVRRQLGPPQGPLDHSALVQSSLRRIHEHFEDLLSDDPTVPHLLAWVKTIVRNRVTDELRRRAAAPQVLGGEHLSAVPDRYRPGEAAERERRAARLAAALARLPERQRHVVEWFWFDRQCDAEISARLGSTVAAVRVLRCRALKELRRLLEANDERAE